jgi:hypothetical protein
MPWMCHRSVEKQRNESAGAFVLLPDNPGRYLLSGTKLAHQIVLSATKGSWFLQRLYGPSESREELYTDGNGYEAALKR